MLVVGWLTPSTTRDVIRYPLSGRTVKLLFVSVRTVTAPDGDDRAVLVIECRESRHAQRMELVTRIQALIRQDLGIDCFIELVPRNTLPRTTSGKLSRSGAKKDFLKRVEDGQTEQPGAAEEICFKRRQTA